LVDVKKSGAVSSSVPSRSNRTALNGEGFDNMFVPNVVYLIEVNGFYLKWLLSINYIININVFLV